MCKFRNSAKKRTKVRRFSQTSALCYAILTILTLTHLVLRVLLVDNEQTTLTTYNLAVWGAFLQRCSCLHYTYLLKLFVSKHNSSFCQVVWAHLHFYFVTRENFDIVHTHLT